MIQLYLLITIGVFVLFAIIYKICKYYINKRKLLNTQSKKQTSKYMETEHDIPNEFKSDLKLEDPANTQNVNEKNEVSFDAIESALTDCRESNITKSEISREEIGSQSIIEFNYRNNSSEKI